MDKIIILDFGGQSCHLISRRIRDLGVLSEVLPSDTPEAILSNDTSIKGIILSGGARSVYDKNAPSFDHKILEINLPILGICYGHQLMAQMLGGKVISGEVGEYGQSSLKIKKSQLFTGLKENEQIWMNHRDFVSNLPMGFKIIGSTKQLQIAAFENVERKMFGLQFHPEVTQTKKGNTIFKNFIFTICACKKTWTAKSLAKSIINETKETIGTQKAILGLSGGVDSSVVAMLVGSAIGKNLIAVYVDTGMMRFNETEILKKTFAKLKINLKIVEAKKQYFSALKGIVEPEQKRKIIGKIFIDIFEKIARQEKADFLIQGTIYSDRIESGLTKNSSVIKSHHNVGGLPKDLKLKLYEPLRNLYKDEVRKLAKNIGLPIEITQQQVFPGPGLAVRIIGEVTPDRVEVVRQAGRIIEQELKNTKYWKNIWMAFAVLLPIKSVGIQGDERSYKNPVVLRIIESKDAMTATFSKIPYALLEKISTRITDEIKSVNRVVYDITNKPPATMEWE